jgi:hypothetical protein
VPAPDDAEVFILCRSAQRQQKEQAMHALLCSASKRGAENRGCLCPNATESPLIAQRGGRLLGKDTRVRGCFMCR